MNTNTHNYTKNPTLTPHLYHTTHTQGMLRTPAIHNSHDPLRGTLRPAQWWPEYYIKSLYYVVLKGLVGWVIAVIEHGIRTHEHV